jgi:hypothetical protein
LHSDIKVAILDVGKGRAMRYLEELEQKVLGLIQKNRDLQNQLQAARNANELLLEQAKQVEESLLKDSLAMQILAQEKAAIVHGIEELLNNINTLESAH